jgi:hypothetical protein
MVIYTTLFIKTLLLNNIKKVIFLIISILAFYFMFKIEDDVINQQVINCIEKDNKFIYVLQQENKYELKVFDEIQLVNNNEMTYSETNGLAIFLFFLFLFTAIGVIISCFEEGWDYQENKKNTLTKLILCYEDGGAFYYILNDKLLANTKKQLYSHDIGSLINEYMRNSNIFPYHETKIEKRDRKISMLLR